MAFFANLRGEVFRVEHRSGVSNKTGNAYSMDTVHVLVEDAGISEITLPRPEDFARITGGSPLPQKGQQIDWLVELRSGEYGVTASLLRDEHYEASKRAYASQAWTPEPVSDLETV